MNNPTSRETAVPPLTTRCRLKNRANYPVTSILKVPTLFKGPSMQKYAGTCGQSSCDSQAVWTVGVLNRYMSPGRAPLVLVLALETLTSDVVPVAMLEITMFGQIWSK